MGGQVQKGTGPHTGDTSPEAEGQVRLCRGHGSYAETPEESRSQPGRERVHTEGNRVHKSPSGRET